MNWRDEYLHRYYRSLDDWRDGTEEFFGMLNAFIPASADVLELGAGPSNSVTAYLADRFNAVDGLDIDPRCEGNEHLRNAHVYDGGVFPLPDDSYDAVVCNYVAEHVEHPRETIGEIRRVLRPGGFFALRTPNRYHYVSLVSSLTPHWFHRAAANRLRALPGESEDPYPTFYRMNTTAALQRVFAEAGFGVRRLETVEKEPSYGMVHPLLFLVFMLYERLVNSAEEFSCFRANILGIFQRADNGDFSAVR